MGEKLTDLPGVGPKTAENLKRAGFDSYDKISKASIRRLSRISGIGKKGAKKIIEAAGGTVITTRKKTKEERMRDKYGEVLDTIDETPADELEDEILDPFGDMSLTTGEISKPDSTVFRPTEEETAESPFRVSISGPRKKSVKKVHENRSERAQDVDEQQNAPITTDEEKWLQNKNRYDYPGVDTIPESRQRRRAENAAEVALEQGAVDRVEQKGKGKNLRGKFSPPGASTYGQGEAVARVQETAPDPEFTLAHEVGHAFDYNAGDDPNRGSLSSKLFDVNPSRTVIGREFDEDDPPIFSQAMQLSERARGGGKTSYRAENQEIIADAISQAILNPRATKRDAPDFFDRLSDVAEEEGFAEAIPDPLANDPEPRGFLD